MRKTHLINTLFMSLILMISAPLQAERLNVGEDSPKDDLQLRVTEEFVKHHFDIVHKISKKRLKKSKNQIIQDINQSLKNDDDRNAFNVLVKRASVQNFTKGQWTTKGYRLEIGPHKIVQTYEDHLNHQMQIDGKTFSFEEYRSFPSFINGLHSFLQENVLKEKVSLLEKSLDLLFPKAHAANRSWKDILLVNSVGTVYLTFNYGTLDFMTSADDVQAYSDLMDHLKKELKKIDKKCRNLKQNVEIDRSGVTTYKLLNKSTTERLENMAGPNGQVDELKLLNSLLSKTATKEEHGEETPEDVNSCKNFFNVFAKSIAHEVKMSTRGFCSKFENTLSCMRDLKAKNDHVIQSGGRNKSLKILNGNRYDENQDAFRDNLGTEGRSR